MSGECDKCGEHNLECGCDRKAFQHLEDDKFKEDGKRIFLEMRKKYPKNNNADLDNILNGLCAALLYFMYNNVDKSNHKYFIQLVYKILDKNT